MFKIGIIGIMGRMGKEITRLVDIASLKEDVILSGGVIKDGHDDFGKKINEVLHLLNPNTNELVFTSDIEDLFKKSDAIIEFTTPDMTMHCLELAFRYKKILVSGTTGLSDIQKEQIPQYAKYSPILWASNMSFGVNLLLDLTKKVASILNDEFDIEIVEMHHRNKADAPSGTAISLGLAAASGRGVSFNEVAQKSRDGFIGPRKKGEIGFATLRGGDVVGEHKVIFINDNGERIELAHKASNRNIFANGAIKAAMWLCNKAPGVYNMSDIVSAEK